MNDTVFFTSLLLAATSGDTHMTGTAHAINVSKTAALIGSHLFRIAILFWGRLIACQARWARPLRKIATRAPDHAAIRYKNQGAVIVTGAKVPAGQSPGNV
ncbi:hypothetical protein M3I53_11295 [Paraburkholderia sp. CNPSo 3272]|uniref:hypothetical protein n=1 Tax=Paraburkholderia sp. CNPSo 3272 TaxID=2940931 RepID=UPI0020B8748B|nr:hypothetical protein [Paraburkholderia sp. CNPSo 3272]MCP3723711.1 hypothetical protein [Paraburkholderia sp. CNPSo 3272]